MCVPLLSPPFPHLLLSSVDTISLYYYIIGSANVKAIIHYN